MNAQFDSNLDLMAALVGEGLNFLRFAQHHVEDLNVANAMCAAADRRAELLEALYDAGAIDDPTSEQPWSLADAALSYRRLLDEFDGQNPGLIGLALFRREQALRHLLELSFAEQPEFKVRRILKGYVPDLERHAKTWLHMWHGASATTLPAHAQRVAAAI